jgi:hypothetical protein
MLLKFDVIKFWEYCSIFTYILAGLEAFIIIYLIWYYFDTLHHRNDTFNPG